MFSPRDVVPNVGNASRSCRRGANGGSIAVCKSVRWSACMAGVLLGCYATPFFFFFVGSLIAQSHILSCSVCACACIIITQVTLPKENGSLFMNIHQQICDGLTCVFISSLTQRLASLSVLSLPLLRIVQGSCMSEDTVTTGHLLSCSSFSSNLTRCMRG